jgi:hypothetical protein
MLAMKEWKLESHISIILIFIKSQESWQWLACFIVSYHYIFLPKDFVRFHWIIPLYCARIKQYKYDYEYVNIKFNK